MDEKSGEIAVIRSHIPIDHIRFLPSFDIEIHIYQSDENEKQSIERKTPEIRFNMI
jgi:hypothetical protein